jgi:aspartate racemase
MIGHMKSKNKIGIIGGAGPEAGLQMMQKIVDICQKEHGCSRDEDFPYMMLLSYPFADMLSAAITDEQKKLVSNQLEECFETFSKNDINIVAIACNTLHLFLNHHADVHTGIKLIHMIDICGKTCLRMELAERLVLCSNTSATMGLHASHFACIYPEADLQKRCQAVIDLVLAGTIALKDVQAFIKDLNHALIHFNKNSPQVGLVLGCTEFSVLNEKFPLHAYGLDSRFAIIDTNEIVARALCEHIF